MTDYVKKFISLPAFSTLSVYLLIKSWQRIGMVMGWHLAVIFLDIL